MAATRRPPAKGAPIKVGPKKTYMPNDDPGIKPARRSRKKPPRNIWKKLTIIVTNENDEDTAVMDHVEIHDATINFWSDVQEIVSNPAFAAVLAGAPAEVVAGLPGESVAYLDLGKEIQLTYSVRFHTVGTGIGKFRPR